MTRLLIGCPVSKREWILDRWFDHVETALRGLDVEVGFVFACDPHWDKPTYAIIQRRAPLVTVLEVAEARPADVRDWSDRRLQKMVVLRNWLLEEVRAQAPDYYLSLDSDILLHPDAIRSLLDAASGFDAVGGKCYMTPLPPGAAALNPRVGTSCPSYWILGRAGIVRRVDVEVPSLFKVDCIMAIKLMTPSAYAVDYTYHTLGEDVGWALECREAGLRFGWDARVTNKHVMRPEHLDVIDPRCGF